MRKILVLLATILILTATILYIRTDSPTILYIPIDNRPVNYSYVASLSEITDITLQMPPPQYLNTGETETDPEPIWDWLETNTKQASAIILSLDTLFYGGLVPSRNHNIPEDVLSSRLSRLEGLASSTKAPIYVFGTIMRSSVTADSFGHPGYFEEYGNKLHRLSILTDKVSQHLATPQEQDDYHRFLAEIPPSVLQDYFERRQKNQNVLLKALSLAETNRLTHIAIGRDDTAPFSFSKMDIRQLSDSISRANQQAPRADTYPGTDEIGALLFARTVLDLKKHTPTVATLYGTPQGEELIPRYEDVSLQESTSARLRTLGANPSEPDSAEILLLVHTPTETFGEAAAQTGSEPDTDLPRNMANKVRSALASGKAVALADIAYVNGADDALMRLLTEEQTLTRLSAYAGWNTAGNSIGTALAHSALHSFYSTNRDFSPQAQQRALFTRIIEDWAYQSVVRQEIRTRYNIDHGGNRIPLQTLPQITEDIEAALNEFTQSQISGNAVVTEVALPWSRLFDIHFTLEFND